MPGGPGPRFQRLGCRRDAGKPPREPLPEPSGAAPDPSRPRLRCGAGPTVAPPLAPGAPRFPRRSAAPGSAGQDPTAHGSPHPNKAEHKLLRDPGSFPAAPDGSAPRWGPRTAASPLQPPRDAKRGSGPSAPRVALYHPITCARLGATSPGQRPPPPRSLGASGPTWSGCGGGGFPLPGCAGCSFMAVIAGGSARLAWAAHAASRCRYGPGQPSPGASRMSPASPGSGAAADGGGGGGRRGGRRRNKKGGAGLPLPQRLRCLGGARHRRAPHRGLPEHHRRAPAAERPAPPAPLRSARRGPARLVPPPSSQQVSQRCPPAWERPFRQHGTGAVQPHRPRPQCPERRRTVHTDRGPGDSALLSL